MNAGCIERARRELLDGVSRLERAMQAGDLVSEHIPRYEQQISLAKQAGALLREIETINGQILRAELARAMGLTLPTE